MDSNNINQLWKLYEQRLDETLLLNVENATAITRLKVNSLLASMKPAKIFAILVGLAWVIFLDSAIIHYFHSASLFLLVPAILLSLLNKLAIGVYLYQLVLIHQADISQPILVTQEKLAKLKSSILWIARLLFLQLPLWTVFYWNNSMWQNGHPFLFVLQAIVTIAFTWLAIWLFRNINYANRNKKWFRIIFGGKEWQPVIQSMELLDQVMDFKTEE